MAIYVIEYKNNKPIAQYTLSGVSAGLSFIEEQESIWKKSRRYRISNRRIDLTKTNGPSIKFP
jgi:hypothetical protein